MGSKSDPMGQSWFHEAEHCRVEDNIEVDDSVTKLALDFVFDMHEIALSYVDRIRDITRFAVKLRNDCATFKMPDATINSASRPSGTRRVLNLFQSSAN